MRALITGGTGFIGRPLVRELLENKWEVVVLSRNPAKVASAFPAGVIGMQWDSPDWASLLGPGTVVVNLAGENIAAGRWTAARKRRILESRVNAGQAICTAMRRNGQAPDALIQASAVGWYGPCGATPVDEYAPSGLGFLADVTRQWEASTSEVEEHGVRRCLIRSGMVLGDGGALKKMRTPFELFMGGPIGTGNQGVSWIHIKDEVAAIRFLMENEAASGPYNLTAPTPVNFRRFASILGNALHRPSFMPTPSFMLRLLFGEMADEVLLAGQFVLPERLIKAGFQFQFTDLPEALGDIVG